MSCLNHKLTHLTCSKCKLQKICNNCNPNCKKHPNLCLNCGTQCELCFVHLCLSCDIEVYRFKIVCKNCYNKETKKCK